MMAVEVGGVALDARALPAIDAEFMAAVDVNVQANVELAAEVTLRADVTVDAALRLDQAVDFFFANEEITVEDAAEITAVITTAFQAGTITNYSYHLFHPLHAIGDVNLLLIASYKAAYLLNLQ